MAGMKYTDGGNLTEKDFLWELSGIGTDVATPVISKGRVYTLDLDGTMGCIDILTGKQFWKTMLPSGNGRFYSSPTLVGNNLFISSDEGAIFVLEITPTGVEIVNQTKFDDNFVATPVLVQDKILLRGTKNLYCIGDKN